MHSGLIHRVLFFKLRFRNFLEPRERGDVPHGRVVACRYSEHTRRATWRNPKVTVWFPLGRTEGAKGLVVLPSTLYASKKAMFFWFRQIVDAPAPWNFDELIEIVKLVPYERGQHRTFEQVVGCPILQVVNEIFEPHVHVYDPCSFTAVCSEVLGVQGQRPAPLASPRHARVQENCTPLPSRVTALQLRKTPYFRLSRNVLRFLKPANVRMF